MPRWLNLSGDDGSCQRFFGQSLWFVGVLAGGVHWVSSADRDSARTPDAGRRQATEIVDRAYVEALASYYPGRLKADATVLKFFMHVARLGGHQNRKGDGFPGWLTLWRGWTKLETLVADYTARPETCSKT